MGSETPAGQCRGVRRITFDVTSGDNTQSGPWAGRELAHLLPTPDRRGVEAVRLLQAYGLPYITVPIDDAVEPELFVGREHFRGLNEIRNYLRRRNRE